MADPQLHVTFNPSAAGSLRRALEYAGLPDIVVSPFDDFSFGPIASDDPSVREAWVASVLGYDGWDEITAQSAPVLDLSRATRNPPIVWVGTDEAQCRAGFLWWLSHMGQAPCSTITAPRIALMTLAQLSSHIGRQIPLDDKMRQARQAEWRRLQSENAPLRILGREVLQSAPLDHFDALLLAHVEPA